MPEWWLTLPVPKQLRAGVSCTSTSFWQMCQQALVECSEHSEFCGRTLLHWKCLLQQQICLTAAQPKALTVLPISCVILLDAPQLIEGKFSSLSDGIAIDSLDIVWLLRNWPIFEYSMASFRWLLISFVLKTERDTYSTTGMLQHQRRYVCWFFSSWASSWMPEDSIEPITLSGIWAYLKLRHCLRQATPTHLA